MKAGKQPTSPCTDKRMALSSSSENLRQRSLAALWHPCTQMQHHKPDAPGYLPLLPIIRGEGSWLIDADGKRYLDAISSWWTNLFGHANPRINTAIREQLETLEHVMLAGCTHLPAIELAEHLAALTDGKLGHAFFASDGASATEIALKMSVHYWKNQGKEEKNGFLCLAGAYHGETLGALSVTDVPIFKQAYAALLRSATVLPSPDARLSRPGETAADTARRAAQALEAHLEQHAGQTAALILEPLVQAAAGMVMYDPEYLRLARALCDRFEVHLICDEIAVGFGRTGTFFAHEQARDDKGASIRPDLMCLSKGISGGYLPLSVVLCRDAIFEVFLDDSVSRAFLHSHSYTGNPLACRAALATLHIFTTDDVLSRNRITSARLAALLERLSHHPAVRHPRLTGMIAAFDVLTDDPDFSRAFHRQALSEGLLLRPIGNTVYLMPPYCVTHEELEFLAAGMENTLHACT